MITLREKMQKIIKDKSVQIDNLLREKMSDSLSEKTPVEIFREELDRQRMAETPDSLGYAIINTPITKIVGFDPKTKRPIYYKSIMGNAIQSG